MYRIKSIIEEVGKDRIDGNIIVKKGVVYLTVDGVQFKHENHLWYMYCDTVWVNLQGGVPDYCVENGDPLLFDLISEETSKDV